MDKLKKKEVVSLEEIAKQRELINEILDKMNMHLTMQLGKANDEEIKEKIRENLKAIKYWQGETVKNNCVLAVTGMISAKNKKLSDNYLGLDVLNNMLESGDDNIIQSHIDDFRILYLGDVKVRQDEESPVNTGVVGILKSLKKVISPDKS